MRELYKAADSDPPQPEPGWIGVQDRVFNTDKSKTSSDVDKELEKMIQARTDAVVRLPIIRKAITPDTYAFGGAGHLGKDVEIKAGETVVLDVVSSSKKNNQPPNSFNPGLTNIVFSCRSKAAAAEKVQTDEAKVQFLNSRLSLADKYGVFSPRRFATISLTSMIKFIAEMRNPRRGHDTQGFLKKIHLDSIAEGYANYMAPMRVRRIGEQSKLLDEKHAKLIFTDKPLNPETDTYLTPTWDEFVPFPMTWKIRFDGFGKSNYKDDQTGNPYGRVRTAPTLPDYAPPWYQPKGPSSVGGTFAPAVCICAEAQAEAKAQHKAAQLPNGEEKEHSHHCPCLGHSKKSGPNTAQLTTGCGLGDSHVHV